MINYRPIITTLGEQIINDAIANNTDIILESIALGDAGVDLEYNVSPDMTSLKNELTRIRIRSINMDKNVFYGEVVARIFGYLAPSNAIAMTVREAGIFDSNGNLIIVTRTSEIETKTSGSLRTGVKIKINKKINSLASELLKVNATGNTDPVLESELLEHTARADKVHRETREQIGLDKVLDISDSELPMSQKLSEMISDTKMATGFIDRTTNRLFNANNMLTLIIDSPTGIYKKGVLYTLTENATINLAYQPEYTIPETGVVVPAVPASSGEFFICLDLDNNKLYKSVNPDVEEEILVAYVICNVLQGIISINDERHTASKNLNWYKTQDLLNKLSWLNGGDLSVNIGIDTNVNIDIYSPIMMANKDIHYKITHNDNPVDDYAQDLTSSFPPVLYLNNSGEIVSEVGVSIPWLNNGSRIVYNNTSGGILEEVPYAKYINYLLIYTADVVAPVKMIVGNVIYNSEAEAEGAEEDVFSYILDRIRCKVAYKLTLMTDSTFVNNVGRVIVSKIKNLADNTSLRNSMSPASHNDLGDSRFEDDQHEIENIEGLTELIANAGKIKNIEMSGNITGDGVAADGMVTIDNRQVDSRLWDENEESVVFTNLVGSVYNGNYKWIGSALAPNGKIYCVPYNSTQVLEINPDTKTTALIGSVYNGTDKWIGAALAPNGKIYCVPYNSTQVLEIDPDTKTTALIGSVYGSGGYKWIGAALAPNGKIYCIPANATQVLEINPDTKTTALIGSVYSDSYKWEGAALAPNGKIYCAPYNATQALEIDPTTKTTTLIGNGYSGSTKWIGAILAPNEKIYCIPANAAQVLEIDIITKTTALIGSVYSDNTKWVGAALASNGKIYCAPNNASQVLEIDPTAKTTTLIGSVYSGGEKWFGAVLAPNGKIYCEPGNSTQVLEIDVFPKSTDYGSHLFNGQFKI